MFEEGTTYDSDTWKYLKSEKKLEIDAVKYEFEETRRSIDELKEELKTLNETAKDLRNSSEKGLLKIIAISLYVISLLLFFILFSMDKNALVAILQQDKNEYPLTFSFGMFSAWVIGSFIVLSLFFIIYRIFKE